MIRVAGIDHLVLRSANVPAMVRFYEGVLGCRVERSLPPQTGLTQLRAGDALIDIVAVDSALGRAGGPHAAQLIEQIYREAFSGSTLQMACVAALGEAARGCAAGAQDSE